MRLLACLIVLLILGVLCAPALLDDSNPEQLGHAARAKHAAPFVSAPSPSEHRLYLGPIQLVDAKKPKPRARTAPTRRVRAAATGDVPNLIRSVFGRFGPTVAEQAVRVFGCESGFNPAARNGQHAGLAQLSKQYQEARARRLGFTWDQMFEPIPNLTVAADIYGESGWRPWTCRRVLG